MKEISYQEDLNHNYMILKGESDNYDNYEVMMITANQVRGLLIMEVHRIDESIEYYYEVTGMDTLEMVYAKKEMEASELVKLLYGILNVLKSTEEYLLKNERLVLNPKYIYIDRVTKDPQFCYDPDREEAVARSFHRLTEYLLDIINHKDNRAVVLSYGLYKKTMDHNYTIQDVLEEIARENHQELEVSETEPKRQEASAGGSGPGETSVQAESTKPAEAAKGKKNKWLLPLILVTIATEGAAIIYVNFLAESQADEAMLIKASIMVLVICAIGLLIFNKRGTQAEQYVDLQSLFPEAEEEGIKDSAEEDEECTVLLTGGSSFRGFIIKGLEEMEGIRLELEKDCYLVGKNMEAVDWMIDERSISRVHCKIIREQDQYFIEDLKSTNGTYINGACLAHGQKTKLKRGDVVRLADCKFLIESSGEK